MKQFLAKYLYCIFSGALLPILFEIFMKVDISSSIFNVVLISFVVIGTIINFYVYKGLKLKSVLLNVFNSTWIFIFSTIVFTVISSLIESKYHLLDPDDMGGGIVLLLVYGEFSVGFIITVFIPMVLKLLLLMVSRINTRTP